MYVNVIPRGKLNSVYNFNFIFFPSKHPAHHPVVFVFVFGYFVMPVNSKKVLVPSVYVLDIRL